MWTVNPVIFESDDVAKSCSDCHRTINQYGGTRCRSSFSTVNPDTIGCVWTGEFDLNTWRVDGETFESGKKKLRIHKYPETCELDGALVDSWRKQMFLCHWVSQRGIGDPLEVQQEASACGFHRKFCPNVCRLVKQLSAEKRKHAIVFHLHGNLKVLPRILLFLKKYKNKFDCHVYEMFF